MQSQPLSVSRGAADHSAHGAAIPIPITGTAAPTAISAVPPPAKSNNRLFGRSIHRNRVIAVILVAFALWTMITSSRSIRLSDYYSSLSSSSSSSSSSASTVSVVTSLTTATPINAADSTAHTTRVADAADSMSFPFSSMPEQPQQQLHQQQEQHPQQESTTTTTMVLIPEADAKDSYIDTLNFTAPVTNHTDTVLLDRNGTNSTALDSAPQLTWWVEALDVKQRAAEAISTDTQNNNATSILLKPPNPPLQLLRIVRTNGQNTSMSMSSHTLDTTTRPIIAIVTSTVSTGADMIQTTVTETSLVRHLLQSLVHSITPTERTVDFRIHLYVAIDDVDQWWLRHWAQLQQLQGITATTSSMSDNVANTTKSTDTLDWLNITFGVFATRPGDIPFNEMALVAYNDGAEYLCRVNDDSDFVSSGWITEAVRVLRDEHEPSNFGVVAPSCKEGNAAIYTHDFVHRSHLDIFGLHYYPPVFDNWFLDDWMTNIYSSVVLGTNFSRNSSSVSQIIPSWDIKHHVVDRRYTAKFWQSQWLPYMYDHGRQQIVNYLTKRKDLQTYASRIAASLATPQGMAPSIVQAIVDTIPSNGNLLVWGLDIDSQYWHRSTTGLVVVLDFNRGEAFTRALWQSYRYVLATTVSYRLQAGDNTSEDRYYQTYVAGQSLDNHTAQWCDLDVVLPEVVLRTTWDVILVKAPERCVSLPCTTNETLSTWDGSGPGVFQPLYMSQLIAARQAEIVGLSAADIAAADESIIQRPTHVFVQHYHRRTERDFSHVLFDSKPNRVLQSSDSDKPDESTTAHYIVDSNHRIRRKNDAVSWCGPPMDFRPAQYLVPWSYPNATAIATSSVVASPQSWRILMDANRGYIDFVLNWLHHFGPLNISIPVVIIAFDHTLAGQLNRDVLPMFKSRFSHVSITVEMASRIVPSTVLEYGSASFNYMVSMRPTSIRQRLEQGYNVIYTDADTVWRSSPLPFLAAASARINGTDAVAAGAVVDAIVAINIVEHKAYNPYYGPGFLAIVSNDRTIQLMTKWEEKQFSQELNTPWFNIVINKRTVVAGTGVQHQPLPLKEFPNSEAYFFQYLQRQRDQAVVVHTNDIADVNQKRLLLQKHGLWNTSL